MQIESSFWSGRQPTKWLAVFGLALLFIVLRWNNFNAPLIRDEGEYAYAAQLLIHGVMPYDHTFIQKPPMVIYSYAFANLLLPDVFWTPRLLAYVCVALATVLLGYIARLEFGKDFALPAMWLMTPMILLPGIDGFCANTEVFMLLPLLATIAAYSRSRHCGHRPRCWLAAGFFSVTTLCYKYTALPMLLFIFAVWTVEQWQQTHDARLLRQSWLVAVLGALLASILELGLFLAHDGGARLWECTVVFNRYYVASGNFNPSYFWSRLETFWGDWWVLFLIPWAILLKPRPRVWLWLGLFICALFATCASCYAQYYVLMVPFWALLCVVGIHALSSRTSDWLARPCHWLGCLVTLAVVLLVIRPDVPWLLYSREQFAEVKMEGHPFLESKSVADHISQLSSPDDFVFVAGSEPQILYYAQRFSPTRFITSYALMIPTPVVRDYQHEAIRDLQKHVPKLIVFVQSSPSWLRQQTTPADFFDFLNNFLNQNYDLVGGYVKNGQKGYWSKQLNSGEFGAASLLLYERKPLFKNAE